MKNFRETLKDELRDKGFKEAFEHYRYSYSIGETVRKLRKAAGLTQRQLAEAMGVPQQSVSRLERGDVDNPTLDTLERIAKATGRKLVVDFVAA